MRLEALVFDVDGTLADSEEAHRQAFNAAFGDFDLAWTWGPALYRGLLEVAGGKERIRHYLRTLDAPAPEMARIAGLVDELHAKKTARYLRSVAEGRVALRPGVARLLAQARAAGFKLAIATTTTAANVEALLRAQLGRRSLEWFAAIACGDSVARKKPAADVYQLALSTLGAPASACVAFEDSAHGLAAAKAAGLFTVVAPTQWTSADDFARADLLLPCLSQIGLDALAALHARVRAPAPAEGTAV